LVHKDLQKKVYAILATPVFVGFDIQKDPQNNLIMRCESGLFKAPGTLTQNPLYRQKIIDYAEVSILKNDGLICVHIFHKLVFTLVKWVCLEQGL
jgi:hypothetical protein